MCPKNYSDEFSQDTRTLFERYYEQIKNDSGLEKIFLLNCLLGLVVIVFEKHKEVLDTIRLSYFSDFLPDSYKRLESGVLKVKKKQNYKATKSKDFVAKIRNGIAHQHIIANLDENGNWRTVTIKDFSDRGKNKDKPNFEITLTVEQLKGLAIAISELVPSS